MFTRDDLNKRLREDTRVLQDERLVKAFEAVDRADFVPDLLKDEAYEDYPLPIGLGQTISQPSTVLFMLELLDVHPGMKVEDVGTGSGWTTALLASIVGDEGEVYGVELIPELVEFGRTNLKKYHFKNAEIFFADEKPSALGLPRALGLPKHDPFDRILVSAAADTLPKELIDQLVPGGVLVVPVRDGIVRITKGEGDTWDEKHYPGFAFVPLVD